MMNEYTAVVVAQHCIRVDTPIGTELINALDHITFKVWGFDRENTLNRAVKIAKDQLGYDYDIINVEIIDDSTPKAVYKTKERI